MKTRDSGMPEEAYWSSFFDPDAILCTLGLDKAKGTVVDVGCGYGTFTLPAAKLTPQRVIALDVEPLLIERLTSRALAANLQHLIEARHQDVAAHGLGLPDQRADIVLLFNVLHCEDPAELLREAFRVLAEGGRVGVIHWRSDIATPRGPDALIRPKPEGCRRWLLEAGFEVGQQSVTLPPYHFGLVGIRPPRTP